MQIFYDYGYGTSNLNGNISGVQWKSNRDNVKRSFGYSYDVSNRLLQGYFAAFGTSWDQELDRYSLASTSYDKNGNIKTLTRKGKTSSPSSYSTIDQLTYTYSGNRLTKIEDAISSTLGYSDFKNGASITTEYTYNNAGSTISDANKGITSLTYNFNELPRVIQFGGASNQITNVYDAEGVKLYSTTVTNGVSKRIDYLEGFIYVDNVIQSFAHEEGRSTWDSDNSVFYDEYFYKDHLGNVRQVIRAPVTSGLRATLETESAAEEEKEFGQISETRILDHRHNNTSGGNQVAWLNADRGRVLGPSRVQEVQSGDSLTLEVDVIFDRKRKGFVSPVSSIKSGSNLLFQDHMLESVNNFKLAPQINPFLIYSITKLVLADINDRKTPESYLMYALYDQDSVLYEQGKVLVSNAAANNHELLYKTLTVEKNGFIETFVVNETSENVYFDNLRVQSTTPIVVQENHYYPFGMTIAGLDYSYNNHSNKFLYNGKELIEDNGLQYYDYGARMYDPAIGRWGVVDPMADSYQAFSPYNYTLNNPIAFTDPNGMWVEGQNGGMFTDDPDDISKFFQAVGDFFHNLLIPSPTQEGNEKQQGTWGKVGRVSKYVNDLHDLQKEVVEMLPGGVLLTGLMDAQTGTFSGEEFGEGLAYEAGVGFIPGGKLIGKVAKTSIQAANGLKINGFIGHGVNRAIGSMGRAGVKPSAILDALKNPLKINNVVTDQLGRQSQRFIGQFGEVVVNPQTGRIISVNPTSSSKAAKLLKQLGQ
ncbi:RHS repeat-associated core domain-containing protein [Algoriphagus yeomjeoni]|uniref:RHS repeat-associated core domain-containing protein n=1 Tax=Algoriphagus yeomjeoni TaxID=291403 RepID=UPI003CE55098